MSAIDSIPEYARAVDICHGMIGPDPQPTMCLRFLGDNLRQLWRGSFGELWISILGQPQTFVQDAKVIFGDES